MALATGVPRTNVERAGPAAIAARSQNPLIVNVVGSINPNAANSFLFVPTEAKYVRVGVLESSKGQPCIDEVEVFSGDSSTNLALHSNGAKATASSLLKGFEEKHQIGFLNDGKYGNERSWIPAQTPGWAQIELPETMTIDRVVLSRDRGGKLNRRVPVSFDILVSTDGKAWSTVKKVRPAAAKKDAARKAAPEKNGAKRKARQAAAAAHSKIGKAGTVPNILWITVEDMSPTLGSYGDNFARTPNIDALAEESVLYTNAFATSPVCSPSRSTLITGMYNASMGTNHMRSSNHMPIIASLRPPARIQKSYQSSVSVEGCRS